MPDVQNPIMLNPSMVTAYTSSPTLAPRQSAVGARTGPSLGQAAKLAGLTSLSNPFLGLVLSGGLSLLAQYQQNKYTRQANELARMNALQDRLHDEWYNSPIMQKLRLKEAGLSPANFIGNFETSSAETPVSIPDQSYLAQAGQSGISAFTNLSTYYDDRRKLDASVRLLEAQADEARVQANTARDRANLELAGKRFENSILAKNLEKIDIDIASSGLDVEAKQIANYVASKTKDMAVQLMSGNLEGLKLDNQCKELEIKGKKYNIDYFLPEQLKHLRNQNEIDQKTLAKLAIELDLLKPEQLEANMRSEVLSMPSIVEKRTKEIQTEFELSWLDSQAAAAFSIVNALVNNIPLAKQLFSLFGKL